MNSARVKDVFHRALELPASERVGFVERELEGADSRLEADEVLSLLRYHEQEDPFLESNALADAGLDTAAPVDGLDPGTRLGPFVIEGPLGRGGMGIVYRGRQESPPRPVAVKIVHGGLGGPALSRRFTREAAVLARLHHPNIAQVYAAGVEVVSGREVPYLAMELIDGKPLDVHMRVGRMDLRQRVTLLERVREGVAHAHQRGVVHRDLKPANILVDASGQPRILDFGIARLVESAASDGTPLPTQQTRRGEILGTLAYMSPEQFEGDPDHIDVRSDVYALGVIMYELLAARPAINLEKLSIAQAALAVSQQEPRPLGLVNPALRGDLETIAAKALEKDPARRYQSAAELAEDLRRHLRDEPILARPATAFYRTAKFVRRNLTVVVLGVAVFLTLLAGIAATGWQALRAEAEYKAANETNRFLQDVLLSTEPERARGQTVTMRMALDEAARKLDAGSIQSERVRASLHGAIGRAYWSLGEMEKSEKHGRAAVELRERFFGKDSREYLDGMCDLAVLLHDVGRDEEAAQISVPAMERSRRLYGAIDQTTVRLITAAANALRDDAPTSLKLYEEAIEIYRKLEGEDGVMTLMASNNLSAWHMDRGDFATAEAITRDVLARRIRLFGEDHPDVFVSMRNLGTCLRGQGRLDEAAEILATCVTSGERVRGIIHPSQLRARLEYGIVTAMKGDPARAELIVREGLPHTLNSDGSPTPLSNEYYGVLGEILAMLNKVDEGLEMAQKAVDAATMLFGMDHPEVQRAASVYVSVYQAAKDWANARQWNDRTEGTPYYQESLRLTPGQDPASPPLETAPSGPP